MIVVVGRRGIGGVRVQFVYGCGVKTVPQSGGASSRGQQREQMLERVSVVFYNPAGSTVAARPENTYTHTVPLTYS